MSKPDGGYAFPTPIAVGPAGDVYAVTQAEFGSGGMTLRDYLAAQALTGMLSSETAVAEVMAAVMADGGDVRARAAAMAYAFADAMLTERKR